MTLQKKQNIAVIIWTLFFFAFGYTLSYNIELTNKEKQNVLHINTKLQEAKNAQIDISIFPKWELADSLEGVNSRFTDSWCDIASIDTIELELNDYIK